MDKHCRGTESPGKARGGAWAPTSWDLVATAVLSAVEAGTSPLWGPHVGGAAFSPSLGFTQSTRPQRAGDVHPGALLHPHPRSSGSPGSWPVAGNLAPLDCGRGSEGCGANPGGGLTPSRAQVPLVAQLRRVWAQPPGTAKTQAQPWGNTRPAGNWALEEVTFCTSDPPASGVGGVTTPPSPNPQAEGTLVSPCHLPMEERPASQGKARPAPGVLQWGTVCGRSPEPTAPSPGSLGALPPPSPLEHMKTTHYLRTSPHPLCLVGFWQVPFIPGNTRMLQGPELSSRCGHVFCIYLQGFSTAPSDSVLSRPPGQSTAATTFRQPTWNLRGDVSVSQALADDRPL